METKKIEVDYFIRNGMPGIFNTILVKVKPGMTPSDVFDIVRKRHKKDKNIVELRLENWEKLKSEL